MEVPEVNAPEGNKVTGSFLRNEFLCPLPCLLVALHMRRDNSIFHGVSKGQSLETKCVEHVVCTGTW